MDIKDRLKRLFKLRFAILYPFGVFVAIFANSDDRSIISGIWFIIIGLLLRVWANGYAIKLQKLTTSGPYALMRHPLYLGTILITVGGIIMLRTYYLGALLLFIMAVVYSKTIKKEEEMLEGKFKDSYLTYKKKVPAIIPTIVPYRGGEKWAFSIKRLIRSKEYKLFFWVIIIVIAFHLKEELLINRENMSVKLWVLIIIAFILGLSDLIGEFVRLRDKRVGF